MRCLSYVFALLVISSAFAFASSGIQPADSKIKLYIQQGIGQGIQTSVEVSLVINNQLLIVKNHPDAALNGSYVEVDRSFDNQEITQAKFTYLIRGKKYFCTADDLPLYVQDGDSNTGTVIHFICN